jgi:hypothetical protein
VRQLGSLITEMIELFADEAFHLGGDEVVESEDKGRWPCGFTNTRSMYRKLIAVVDKAGKTPMTWDEPYWMTGASIGTDAVAFSSDPNNTVGNAAMRGQPTVWANEYLDLNNPWW